MSFYSPIKMSFLKIRIFLSNINFIYFALLLFALSFNRYFNLQSYVTITACRNGLKYFKHTKVHFQFLFVIYVKTNVALVIGTLRLERTAAS